MSDQAQCHGKHTKYQPTEDEFRCPRCGAEVGIFVVQETEGGANLDCELNHPGDSLGCDKCGYGTSGRAFAARVQREKGLVPCQHCKGTGLVKGETT